MDCVARRPGSHLLIGMRTPSPSFDRVVRALPLALLLLALGLYAWNLGSGSLAAWDESLTAARSREMLIGPDRLVPHTGGEADFNKPPLYYWISALLFRVFGESEWTVRAPSAAFGLGCLACVYLLAWRLGGRQCAGLWACSLLLLNADWINETREGLLDSGMLLGTLAAVLVLLSGAPSVRRGAAAGACFAFGSLIKNPAPILGLAIPLMEWAWVRREPVPRKMVGSAVVVFLVLGLGWYALAAAWYGPAFVETFLHRNLTVRFVEGFPIHQGGPLFYFDHWFSLAAPSLILFIAAALFWLAGRQLRGRPAAPFILFTIFLLAALTASASKRVEYLLIVYPWAAVATGMVIEEALSRIPPVAVRRAAGGVLAVVMIGFFAVAYIPKPDHNPDLKAALLSIRAEAQPGDAVLPLVPKTGALAHFYSHLRVYTDKYPDTEQRLRAADARTTGSLFLLVPTADAGSLAPLLAKQFGDRIERTPLARNAVCEVYRVACPARTFRISR
jgi:4-amino-4-deoxy-L-arabinose transferase-like glycosyltransferase